MKKLSLIISLLYGTTMLHGCASTTSESQNWTIEPFQRIQHATNRPDGYYQLGRYYQGQNRFDLAAGAYRKALAIDPNFTEAYNGLGTVYASQGKYKQALAEFDSAIARTPDAAHIYNNVGYLNYLEGDFSKAVAAFTKATALDPANQKAWNNLGMALAKSGEPMKSNQAFAKAIETTASAQPAAGSSTTNHVAAASEANQTAPTLTVPKDRGVIDYTSANKPEGNNTDRLNADNTREEKPAAPARLAQPAAQPPFAVIEAPNSGAMPVVMVNGSPYSAIEKVTVAKIQPPPVEVKPAPVASNVKQASSAAPVLAAKKTEPKTQRAMTSLKHIDLKESSQKATPSRAVRTAAIPKERPFKLEVSNGNGIRRLASRVSSMLSTRGLPRASVSNHTSFNQTRTVIHFRKGYRFEAARLSRSLSGTRQAIMMEESRNLPAKTDVRLVLGKDLSGKLNWMDKVRAMTLASR